MATSLLHSLIKLLLRHNQEISPSNNFTSGDIIPKTHARTVIITALITGAWRKLQILPEHSGWGQMEAPCWVWVLPTTAGNPAKFDFILKSTVSLNRTSSRGGGKCEEGWVSSNVARVHPKRGEWQLWLSDLKWKDEVMHNDAQHEADRTLTSTVDEAFIALWLHHKPKGAAASQWRNHSR